jgi:excisionase family DNA binding protein
MTTHGITIKEAAEILNVSVGTMRNWDKNGRLKAIRAKNGYRRYQIRDLEKFADKNGLKRKKRSGLKLV